MLKIITNLVRIAPTGLQYNYISVIWWSNPATNPDTLGRELSRWRGRYGACFCSHSRSFVELEPFRGTRNIGARDLSRCRN